MDERAEGFAVCALSDQTAEVDVSVGNGVLVEKSAVVAPCHHGVDHALGRGQIFVGELESGTLVLDLGLVGEELREGVPLRALDLCAYARNHTSAPHYAREH